MRCSPWRSSCWYRPLDTTSSWRFYNGLCSKLSSSTYDHDGSILRYLSVRKKQKNVTTGGKIPWRRNRLSIICLGKAANRLRHRGSDGRHNDTDGLSIYIKKKKNTSPPGHSRATYLIIIVTDIICPVYGIHTIFSPNARLSILLNEFKNHHYIRYTWRKI